MKSVHKLTKFHDSILYDFFRPSRSSSGAEVFKFGILCGTRSKWNGKGFVVTERPTPN